ncbi:hypothetical protein F3J23_13970 [Chryseobacterium sp. Tr-659]|uniref:hypothetical protein n=1 Tax=Chryseobacterium sp. Tr-659 TaxID=2608340 RepID=UPI00141F148B|nr:hypothetical protein [Chryseobacterium sp. Tr-659]NIF06551.1 hypothetical protein [Chryseobacterium sp. Tr-659]
MKKKAFLLSTIFSAIFVYAQVGINTITPKATLDIEGNPSDISKIDGLIVPRLTRAELTTKGDSLYGNPQNGSLIYITNVSGGNNLSQRVNITATGYYYFDSNINQWKNITGGPWNMVTSIIPASANNQDIYQMGKVGIGDFSIESPTADLDVKGSVFTRTDSGIRNMLYFNSTATATPDVLMKRTSANNLQTEAVFTVRNNGSSGTVNVQSFDAVADSFPSFAINKDGVIVLGSGDAATDVRLSRGGANLFRAQNTTFAVSRTGPIDTTPAIRVSTNDLNSVSNPNPMFEVMINGKLRWGAGTVNIPDINLERDATTSKLKLTGVAYSGSAGNRYLLIDPSTGLISMSTGSASSVARSSNAFSNIANYDVVIEDLKSQIKSQNEKITQLEIILNKLSSQIPN